MQLDTMQQGEVLIVTISDKRLDARNATSFRESTSEYIKAGHRKLIVNLAAVEFIDSSGLGALVSILKTLGPQGELVLCGIRASIFGLFKLTRMDKVFFIVPGEAEAFQKLAA
jgi:anti-sigma B factor antagonist